MKLENKVAKAVRAAAWISLVLGILGSIDIGFTYQKIFNADTEFNVLVFIMCALSSVVLCILLIGFSELIEQSYQKRQTLDQTKNILLVIKESLKNK